MKDLLNKILIELSSNKELNNDPLVKMLVESSNRLLLTEKNVDSIYDYIKNNLVNINYKLNNKEIEKIINKYFNKKTEDFKLTKLSESGKLRERLERISESNSKDPIIISKIEKFNNLLNSGVPEFILYPTFIKTFENYDYDSNIKSEINDIKNVINENKKPFLVLSAIYEMEKTKSKIYENIVAELKKLLVKNKYSADILKIKYGNSFPIVNQLIESLRIIESEELGSFTLGEGNNTTKIKNLIAPAIYNNKGIILFNDNRFLFISESKKNIQKDFQIHINEKFIISSVSPEYIKKRYPNFYNLCESYSFLGFKQSEDGLSLISNYLKSNKFEIKINENKELDFYINENKIDLQNINNIDLHNRLILENKNVKYKINSLLENLKNIYHFEFIKHITSDKTLNEALVFKLDESYYICDMPNASQRFWSKMNETQMHEFFIKKFNYDISNIFKIKLNRDIERLKLIESEKSEVLNNIQKLEKTVEKIKSVLNSNDLEKDDISHLESIKESIVFTIKEMKDHYIKLDLNKEKI